MLEYFQQLLAGDNFWLLVFAGVFLAGILTSFNPCMYAMIPTIAGYAGLDQTRKVKITYLTGFFVLGFSVTLSMYGLVGAILGSNLEFVHNYWAKAAGLIFLILALYLLGLIEAIKALVRWLPLKVFYFYQQKEKPARAVFAGKPPGAFLFGIFFGLAPTPCTAPVVLAVLTYVVPKGELLYSSLLLFAYGIGHGIPLLVAAGGAQWLEQRFNLGLLGYWGKKAIGAVLLVFAWYYLVYQAGTQVHLH